jgi:hypothetical protein
MFGLTVPELSEYGAIVFTLWLAQFLVREIWKLFKNKLESIHTIVEINKNSLIEVSRNLKESSIIQKQIIEALCREEKVRAEGEIKRNLAWDKLIEALHKICGLMNGGNPAILKIQEEIKKLQKNT